MDTYRPAIRWPGPHSPFAGPAGGLRAAAPQVPIIYPYVTLAAFRPGAAPAAAPPAPLDGRGSVVCMVRLARLSRNGNSVSVSVPPPFLRELHWRRGDLVALAVEGGRLVGRKVEENTLVAAPPPDSAFEGGRTRRR